MKQINKEFTIVVFFGMDNIEKHECSQASLNTFIAAGLRSLGEDPVSANTAGYITGSVIYNSFSREYLKATSFADRAVAMLAAIQSAQKTIKDLRDKNTNEWKKVSKVVAATLAKKDN